MLRKVKGFVGFGWGTARVRGDFDGGEDKVFVRVVVFVGGFGVSQ